MRRRHRITERSDQTHDDRVAVLRTCDAEAGGVGTVPGAGPNGLGDVDWFRRESEEREGNPRFQAYTA